MGFNMSDLGEALVSPRKGQGGGGGVGCHIWAI